MFGCLIVDKPGGITSHDIISILRKRFKIRRIGHAGTLDPLATGIVVVAVGQATRFLNFMPTEPKVYEGKALLGISTDTYDKEGQIVSQKRVPSNYIERIEELVPTFIGKIWQLPPIYSALKKDGKPLYAYARQGIEVEIHPREIHIYSLEINHVEENVINFKVSCSGGTYIRSLVHDLGELLGCGAHLTDLRRTAVGKFTLEQAINLDEITVDDILLLEDVLSDYRNRVLTEVEINKVKHGQQIKRFSEDEIQVLIDDKGLLLALSRAEGDFLQPFCVVNRD